MGIFQFLFWIRFASMCDILLTCKLVDCAFEGGPKSATGTEVLRAHPDLMLE